MRISLRRTGTEVQLEEDIAGSRWIGVAGAFTVGASGVTNTYRPGLEAEIAGRIWPAGLALVDYLDWILSRGRGMDGLNVLELGAGSGLVGLALYRMLAWKGSRAHIVVTDLPNAIPLLETNCELNRRAIEGDRGGLTLEAGPLAWGSTLDEKIKDPPPDLVLMADLVYWPALHPLLVQTCLDLAELNQSVELLLAYREREPVAEAAFFEEFGRHFVLEGVEDEWFAEFDRGPLRVDDGRIFLFRARRPKQGESGLGADQFESLKMLAIDVDV
ncbi:putative methyltransferase-domain-containing protein [Hyaloraphidium curvatum]|nr:putative methyltransferase-domain-containing protein [Hyaloraphidium curvatum]